MSEIPLSRGQVAIVDDEDFAWLSQWKWSLSSNGYACREDHDRRVYMHRQILDTRVGVKTDHINGDTLDNRRANLRVASHSQNLANGRKHRDAQHSRYKGVWRSGRLWAADVGGKHLGTFTSEEAAALAYNWAALARYGEFALLNDLYALT